MPESCKLLFKDAISTIVMNSVNINKTVMWFDKNIAGIRKALLMKNFGCAVYTSSPRKSVLYSQTIIDLWNFWISRIVSAKDASGAFHNNYQIGSVKHLGLGLKMCHLLGNRQILHG